MTHIQWTDETWNPVVGCTPVSPGCAHCYAQTMAKRLQAMGTRGYEGVVNERGHWTGKVNLIESVLEKPLGWRKPRMVFVNSMSDLFHESVPFEFITRVFDTMSAWRWPSKKAEEEGDEEKLVDPGHTYQILTKRPERILPWMDWVGQYWPGCSPYSISLEPAGDIPKHIWIGASIENQDNIERIDHLREVPASVRFLSLEPLLGPMPSLNLEGIHWVIVGGESGHSARPCDVDWIRDIVRQCRAAGVACFVKQMGSKARYWAADPFDSSQGHWESLGIDHPKGGDLSEFPTDLQVREFPR